MTIQVSTKFKELILGTSSFTGIFAYGKILIYSGPQPATADMAPTGTLLAEITENGGGGGLLFTQTGAFITKSPSQGWNLLASVAGSAGWFRLVGAAADPGGLSYFLPRIDGSIGTTAAFDMTLTSTALTVGQNITVQQFLYTIPPVI